MEMFFGMKLLIEFGMWKEKLFSKLVNSWVRYTASISVVHKTGLSRATISYSLCTSSYGVGKEAATAELNHSV